MRKEFQVFVKPVGSSCNLRCRYCYYTGRGKGLSAGESSFMSPAIAGEFIRQLIEASGEIVNFSWHGGEPLLAGLEFFREVTALQKKYNKYRKKIINGIQTNGTLVDEKWCAFFKEENFLAGISMDGPERFHDINRVTGNNSSSFGNVLRGYKLLQKYGVEPEILCVVNSLNVNYPLEIYRYFKSLGAKYMTFLPLVELTEGGSRVSGSTVPSEDFGIFMSQIFDEWTALDIGKVKVQLFEEATRSAFGQDHTLCVFKKTCGGVPVLERNGDFYSCDHYVDSEHLAGNILQISLKDLLNSEVQEVFGNLKSATLPESCKKCNVLDMCNGECPKNRFSMSSEGQPGLNYLCEGYKYFFNHCKPFVNAVATAYRYRKG